MRSLLTFCALSIFTVVVHASSELTLITPDNDDRLYRHLVLGNGLPVLLVSDPSSEKSAASLDVNVGAGNDPIEKPGLAHFLEHMLFLGTEKYPKAGEYQEFISAHGGNNNAFTSYDHTNYHFDVASEYFEPALDRFSQFFTAPLFNETFVNREKNAVHSEYKAKIKDDFRRAWDVYKSIINSEHPSSKFTVGSLETLTENAPGALRNRLVAFYREHYAANKMALSVLGPQSLDQLQSWVQTKFGAISSKPSILKKEAQLPPLFKKGTLPLAVELVPEKDLQRLSLEFPLPPVKHLWQQKPLNYIGFFLGHEGKGSLLSELKRRGLAQRLSAGAGFSSEDSSTFKISIDLTEEGLKKRDEVVKQVFAAIHLLKQNGIEEWRFNELKTMADLEFRFAEKPSELRTVIGFSNAMHDYPVKDLMRAGYAMDTFSPRTVSFYLSLLNPDNLLLTTSYKAAKTQNKTQYYHVPYGVEKISAEKIQAWKNARSSVLALPGANLFIPKKLAWGNPKTEGLQSLLGGNGANDLFPQQLPLKLFTEKQLPVSAWYKHNHQFKLPKADVRIRIYSPNLNGGAEDFSRNELMVALLGDQLNELTYTASMAGLGVGLIPHTRGLDIRLNGFDPKMPVLLEKVVEKLASPIWKLERFDDIKADAVRSLRNAQKEVPYRQLMSEAVEVTYSKVSSEEQLLAVTETLTLKDVKAFSRNYFDGAEVKALIYGNADALEAEQWLAPLANLLSANTERKPDSGNIARLPEATLWRELDLPHKDKAAVLFVQGHNDVIKERALMLLLRQIMHTPFYYQLRTERQLGYMVFATGLPVRRVAGTALVVQSPSTPVPQLKKEISGFLERFQVLLAEESEESYDKHKQALLLNLQEPDKNMGERAGRYWMDLGLGYHGFDRLDQLVQAVNAISKNELIEFYNSRFVKSPRSLWLTSGGKLDGVTPLQDTVSFKKKYGFYQNY
ncbi:MAG: insulinase family protein [Cellvibrionaceae bacterium]